MFTKTKGASKALKGAAALAASLMIGMVTPGVVVAQTSVTTPVAGSGAATQIDVTTESKITIHKKEQLQNQYPREGGSATSPVVPVTTYSRPPANGETITAWPAPETAAPKAVKDVSYTAACLLKVNVVAGTADDKEDNCLKPSTNDNLILLTELQKKFTASPTATSNPRTAEYLELTAGNGVSTDQAGKYYWSKRVVASATTDQDGTAVLKSGTFTFPRVNGDNGELLDGDETAINNDTANATRNVKILPGLYKVTETKAPVGYAISAPFVVMLPMTSSSGTTWNYDVHVYPKNDAVKITKSLVNDTARGMNKESTATENATLYTVNATIPAYSDTGIARFTVVDWLPDDMTIDTTLDNHTFMKCPKEDSPKELCESVAAGTDGANINVTYASADTNGHIPFATMDVKDGTRADLKTYAEKFPGAVLRWIYPARALTVVKDNGSTDAAAKAFASATSFDNNAETSKQTNNVALITEATGSAALFTTDENNLINSATLNTSNADLLAKLFKLKADRTASTLENIVPKDDESTVYRRFTVKKTNQLGDVALGGMKFRIYACDAAGKLQQTGATTLPTLTTTLPATTVNAPATEVEPVVTPTNVPATTAAANVLAGDPISSVYVVNKGDKAQYSTGFTNEFETGADGTVDIYGLVTTDTINGSTNFGGRYCIQETKAPEGYERNPNPVVFELSSTGTDHVVVSLKNIDANAGFKLPFTGGKGIIPFIVMGILLVAAAGFWFLAGKRRKDEEENYA